MSLQHKCGKDINNSNMLTIQAFSECEFKEI